MQEHHEEVSSDCKDQQERVLLDHGPKDRLQLRLSQVQGLPRLVSSVKLQEAINAQRWQEWSFPEAQEVLPDQQAPIHTLLRRAFRL